MKKLHTEKEVIEAAAGIVAMSQTTENLHCGCGKPRLFNLNICSQPSIPGNPPTLIGFGVCEDCLELSVSEILNRMSMSIMTAGQRQN